MKKPKTPPDPLRKARAATNCLVRLQKGYVNRKEEAKARKEEAKARKEKK